MKFTTRDKLNDAIGLMERAKRLLEEARDEVDMSYRIATLTEAIADVEMIQGDLEELMS